MVLIKKPRSEIVQFTGSLHGVKKDISQERCRQLGNKLLSPQEAARLINVVPAEIKRRAEKGELPVYYRSDNKKYYFIAEEVEEYRESIS